ncbi:adenylyl cyclase-associated protein 1 [Galendromus occidentalis]|uniref:Adenylyl cyclase-associated protein 1 n=1 Tax=Galendromus occidentalis TaxID=34638 RepID=A0AAJ7PA06_9ACAR|nr:adenylyl cyclase-associated protein 1 [Galendromus occidentalis]
MSTQELESLIRRLESVATRLETSESRIGGGSAPSDEEVAAFVSAFDEIVSGPFVTYMKLSNQIGSDVAKHAEMVDAALKLQRNFVQVASKSKKPSTDQLMALLKPQSEAIQKIQSFREANRTSKQYNHLSAISESIPFLGWVAVAPTPGPYVKEMADACKFYTNRVLMEYKDKDKTHVEWTKAWLEVLNQLQAYIKQYHTTGLTWNPKGGDAAAAAGASAVRAPAAAPAAGAPPPPPPPPSMELLLGSGPSPAAAPSGGGDPRAALFASINQGADITRALKKVSADQMTHKNPNLRSTSVVPAKAPTVGPKPATAPKPAVVKPPRCELDGKKWIVEFQRDVPQLVLDDVHMNQVVYVYGCQNSVIIVKGKCNSISVDNCKKTSIVFDDIVSTVEFVNCQSVKAQAMGVIPIFSIDKTDGAHIYLSEASAKAEIVTSKASEVNVSVPSGPDGDYVECAIPEQFKSVWNGKGMKTDILDIAA